MEANEAVAQAIEPELTVEAGEENVEQLHDKAWAFLRQWELPPKPYAYEVAYVYFEGNSKSLVNDVIDEAVRRANALDDYLIQQIHAALRNDGRPDLWNQLNEEVLVVNDIIERQSHSSSRFSKSLNERKQQITNVTTIDQFREMITGLVSENERILEETEGLRDELKHSTDQISELTSKLEEARGKELEDELTRIGNRRYFNESLQKEHMIAQRDDTPLCLAMADIDWFKKINDTYGHAVGDAVLCFFAKLIDSNIKGKDHVARFGGEEFAVILPDTELHSAAKLIDKIRRDMHARNIVIVEDNMDIGKVTSSFGVAKLEKGQSIEALIKQADDKLYEAKRSGRNCVKF